MGFTKQISVRNAAFQQWEALLENRKKRSQLGSFIVQGVRPITLAIENKWNIEHILFDNDRRLSAWATAIVESTPAEKVAVSNHLMGDLGEKTEDIPELLAVVSIPKRPLSSVTPSNNFLGVVFDRPTSPGNLGSLIRSADAFSADVVMITGHAADPYDSKCVRASTGSLFAVPVIGGLNTAEITAWASKHSSAEQPLTIVGTDENSEIKLANHDFTGPTLLVIGNETSGMSRAWTEAVDATVRIPIGGAASSLNAAAAGSISLYEVARQRS